MLNMINEQAGIDFLNRARKDQVDRKKASDDELNAVCLDGAKHVWSRPVSVIGNFQKSSFKKRKHHKCFVCRTTGGTFYIED